MPAGYIRLTEGSSAACGRLLRGQHLPAAAGTKVLTREFRLPKLTAGEDEFSPLKVHHPQSEQNAPILWQRPGMVLYAGQIWLADWSLFGSYRLPSVSEGRPTRVMRRFWARAITA